MHINNEYVDKTKQEKPEETPQNLRDYIESNPEHKQELINSGFLKQRQVPLTPEELSGKVYEKAGFTPEDKDFYEQFKKSNFDVQGHNDAIREMLYKKAPGLISRGKEGTRLMDLYSQRLASETITPQAPTVYGYTSLGNDKMLKHDSYGNYEVIDLGTGKPDKTMDPKNWEVEKVGDKYYWSQWAQDKNGWNKKLIKELTPTEMEDYQQGLKDEDVDRQLKEKRLSGGTSRSRRGGKKTKTPEQQIVGKTVATLSKLGLTHSGQKWDDWEEKDKDTYEKAFKWMQENTDLEDDEIHSAIKKYEETGKIPDDLFDAGDDEENTDNGDDNPEEDYFSEALNEIDKNDKYDNTEKSARMRMAFEHYKQKEKSKDKISGARKTYLKKIGAY
jgi:hypothetical protein